jgi:hypothetical protein
MMAHLSGIQIGKQARALAAALALGAAVLSLSTGPTAYAARVSSTDAGDADTGAGDAGSGTATRDPRARCTITRPDGHIDFYLPGTVYTRPDGQVFCGSDGQWHRNGIVDRATVGGGGVATQAP